MGVEQVGRSFSVARGVEASPGVKDHALVRAFVVNAKQATVGER